MRVSCVCFGRIGFEDSYTLVINRRRPNGSRSLAPVGDNLSVSRGTTAELIQSFGAFDFEELPALRLHVPHEQVEGLLKWFERQGRGGVRTVKRAMLEELALQTGVLSVQDIKGAAVRLATTVRFDAPTHRKVTGDPMTAYLVQVLDVTLGKGAMQRLVDASQLSSPGAPRIFVASAALIKGRRLNGTEISPITETLLG